MSENNKRVLREIDLGYFTGTEEWHRHPSGLLYTDGVKYVAENGGAYWLIDAVASYQGEPALALTELQEFQLWELAVDRERNSAVLTCRADTGRKPVVRQEIEYTDFPLDEIKLYVECGVLLLPSEH